MLSTAGSLPQKTTTFIPTLLLEAVRCPEWPSARLYAFFPLALLPQVISPVLGPPVDLTLEESDVVLRADSAVFSSRWSE